jgi:hypothetical protein
MPRRSPSDLHNAFTGSANRALSAPLGAGAGFQRRAGVIGPDADGAIVGPRTWAAPKSRRDDCVTAG